MQVTKLLQLKKSTLEDIGIIFDVCWILTPVQIQKLINVMEFFLNAFINFKI